VLETLWEQPAHPYQVVQILKRRGKHEAARLNFGALYGVVASLEKAGLIEAVSITREGNLPARTTYRATEAGAEEMRSWLSDLLARPVKEYPQFMAALSLLVGVSPQEALRLLTQRAEALEGLLEKLDASLGEQAGALEVFSVETRYERCLIQADLGFTRSLIEQIASGSLGGSRVWQEIYVEDGRPLTQRVDEALGGPPPAEA
jgi:DNA-binding PadR family transcriptional regulator